MDAFQVPVIDGTLVELNGNKGGIEFWHKGPMELNVGITFGFTVIRTVFEPVHPEVVPITLKVVVEVGITVTGLLVKFPGVHT
jgi:hypothetical protein